MSSPPLEPTRAASLNVAVELAVDDDLDALWDEPRIGDLVRAILSHELPAGGEYAITLHLVTEQAIRAMNAEQRGIDACTDVLSFPLHDAVLDAQGSSGFILPPGEPTHLGDVVVCYPRAVEQAQEYGHSTQREVGYLVAHGVLHVLGYDHVTETDRTRMRQREEEALRPLGFTR